MLLLTVAALCTRALTNSRWISGSGMFAATVQENAPVSRDVHCGLITYCIVGEPGLCDIGYGGFGDIPVEQWSTAAATTVLGDVVVFCTMVASVIAMFADDLAILLWARHGPPVATMCLFAGVAFTVVGLHDTAEGIGTDTLCHMCPAATSSSPGEGCEFGEGAIMLFTASALCVVSLAVGYVVPLGSAKIDAEAEFVE